MDECFSDFHVPVCEKAWKSAVSFVIIAGVLKKGEKT